MIVNSYKRPAAEPELAGVETEKCHETGRSRLIPRHGDVPLEARAVVKIFTLSFRPNLISNMFSMPKFLHSSHFTDLVSQE